MDLSFCLCLPPPPPSSLPQLCRCHCKVNGQLTIVQTFLNKNLCDCDVDIICNVQTFCAWLMKLWKKTGIDKLNRTKSSPLWCSEIAELRTLVKLRTFVPWKSPVWFVPAFIKLQLSNLAFAVQKAFFGFYFSKCDYSCLHGACHQSCSEPAKQVLV